MNTEIIIAVIGIIAAIFGGQGFWTWVMHRGNSQSNEAKLLLGIAYSHIIQQCDFYIRRGWISADEFNELNHYFYEPYKAMGGNGTAERQMGIVSQLPPQKKGDKHEQD